jgi:hypothetical protein
MRFGRDGCGVKGLCFAPRKHGRRTHWTGVQPPDAKRGPQRLQISGYIPEHDGKNASPPRLRFAPQGRVGETNESSPAVRNDFRKPSLFGSGKIAPTVSRPRFYLPGVSPRSRAGVMLCSFGSRGDAEAQRKIMSHEDRKIAKGLRLGANFMHHTDISQ